MQKKKRLLWHLYPAFLLVGLLSIVPVTWYASDTLKKFFLRQASLDLEARARMVENRISPYLEPPDTKKLKSICKGMGQNSSTRITVIGPSGIVLGDSHQDPSLMDNHAGRPEVMEAIEKGRGESLRFSRTLQSELMYVGIAVPRGGKVAAVVRTSIPVSRVNAVLKVVQGKIALVGLLIAFLSAGVSYLVSRRIGRRMEEIRNTADAYASGDFEVPSVSSGIWEIDQISSSMKKMAGNIREQIEIITLQRNELDTVLSSMAEGVIAIDPGAKVLSINGAAARLFGVDQSRAAGTSIEEVTRNTRLSRFVQTALQGTGDVIEEDIPVRTEGGGRILNARATSLLDPAKAKIGVVLVMSDVTRVRELENMRRDFVANVSHEIKTPITAIKGFVETLLDGEIDNRKETRHFLEIIQKHAGRLEAIIEDLLNLSRIEQEAGSGKVAFTETLLRDVLESAVEFCTAAAQSKGVQVELKDEGNITAGMDKRLMEQAVINLLDNAIKYSPRGGRVEVKAYFEGGKKKISVSDEGIGIEQEHISRIFERFYRVDKGRSRSDGGTGLGLAIVKHVVEIHGGKVTVESEPGNGSTFTIELP